MQQAETWTVLVHLNLLPCTSSIAMKRTFIVIVHEFILMLEMPNTPYDPAGENREGVSPWVWGARETQSRPVLFILGGNSFESLDQLTNPAKDAWVRTDDCCWAKRFWNDLLHRIAATVANWLSYPCPSPSHPQWAGLQWDSKSCAAIPLTISPVYVSFTCFTLWTLMPLLLLKQKPG